MDAPSSSSRKRQLRRRRQAVTLIAIVALMSYFLRSQVGLLVVTDVSIRTSSSSTISIQPEDTLGASSSSSNITSISVISNVARSSLSGIQQPRGKKNGQTILKWNEDGCQTVTPPPRGHQYHKGHTSISASASTSHSSSPPKGLVVTMALAPKGDRILLSRSRKTICTNLPNQIEWFLHPQSIDLLLVVQEEGPKRWSLKQFATCLNLIPKSNDSSNNNSSSTTDTLGDGGIIKTWKNLDGSHLTTIQYFYNNHNVMVSNTDVTVKPISIYLAKTTVRYPKYIQNDPSKLDDRLKYGPKGCSSRLRYLQGCRWYTTEMLHLGILQKYDYFFKLDTDVIFEKSLNFYILQDMHNKGSIFAHAAEYGHGDGSCAPGILPAIDDFVKDMHNENHNNDIQEDWTFNVCSSHLKEMQRNADQYYSNFMIGSVEYFTSYWVLKFAKYLSEYPKGWFYNKWGDQIFWHYAMGIFVTNFTKYVEDYTDIRCKPDINCWYSVFDIQTYGDNATEQCDQTPNGIFVHTKNLNLVTEYTYKNASSTFFKSLASSLAGTAKLKNDNSNNINNDTLVTTTIPSIPITDPANQPLFVSTYKFCM